MILAESMPSLSACMGRGQARAQRLRGQWISDPGAIDGADVTVHCSSRPAFLSGPGEIRSRALVVGDCSRTSKFFLFPVWWGNPHLYRRAVRVDGRNPGSRHHRQTLANAVPRRFTTRDRAEDHVASRVTTQRASGTAVTRLFLPPGHHVEDYALKQPAYFSFF